MDLSALLEGAKCFKCIPPGMQIEVAIASSKSWSEGVAPPVEVNYLVDEYGNYILDEDGNYITVI